MKLLNIYYVAIYVRYTFSKYNFLKFNIFIFLKQNKKYKVLFCYYFSIFQS